MLPTWKGGGLILGCATVRQWTWSSASWLLAVLPPGGSDSCLQHHHCARRPWQLACHLRHLPLQDAANRHQLLHRQLSRWWVCACMQRHTEREGEREEREGERQGEKNRGGIQTHTHIRRKMHTNTSSRWMGLSASTVCDKQTLCVCVWVWVSTRGRWLGMCQLLSLCWMSLSCCMINTITPPA